MLARNHEDSRSFDDAKPVRVGKLFLYIPCVDHVFTCIYTMCTSYMHIYI